jgi:hypothetical protein
MRTVAALFDSRAEAELARSRLISELGAKSPRILAKDTAAAVDSLKIAREDAEAYRDGLRSGGHLLVVQLPSGANAERAIDLLEQSIGDEAAMRSEEPPEAGEHGIQVEIPCDADEDRASGGPPEEASAEEAAAGPAADKAPPSRPVEEPETAEARTAPPQAPPGGARVRAFTHDAEAEEQVSLHDETIEVENRPSERHLTEGEIEAGGLFKERVFEIAEMREEPVVSKVAVVREEIIVRKKIKERVETIRDTVRQTQVEVEDLPPDGDAPSFFGASGRRPQR